jgi:hypothetical protein
MAIVSGGEKTRRDGHAAIFTAQILRLACLRQASAWQARRHYSVLAHAS